MSAPPSGQHPLLHSSIGCCRSSKLLATLKPHYCQQKHLFWWGGFSRLDRMTVRSTVTWCSACFRQGLPGSILLPTPQGFALPLEDGAQSWPHTVHSTLATVGGLVSFPFSISLLPWQFILFVPDDLFPPTLPGLFSFSYCIRYVQNL